MKRTLARCTAATLACLIWLLGWEAATLMAAARLTPKSIGAPLCIVAGHALYAPWKWYLWIEAFGHDVPPPLREARAVGYLTLLAILVVAAIGRRMMRKPPKQTHGAARWATLKEVRAAGFGHQEGVVLCQSADAKYTSSIVDGELRWTLKRHGELICDNGPGHVFLWAPSGAGKLIGFVAPTAFNWHSSAIIYDTKKEIWSLTAGWRSQFSRCLRYEPANPHSVKFNSLFQIPRDERDVAGAQSVATILCQTHSEQSQGSGQHWKLTATDLITGAILHVLYAGARKSLTGVRELLAGDGQNQVDVLLRMASTPHLGDRPHPQILAYATAGLNMAPNERSGVFSTAISHLGVFLDPIVARNTDTSDFSIDQLINLPEPVSLYLVVEPPDEERLRPLMRLMLDQIGKTLMRDLEPRRLRKSLWARLWRVLWAESEHPAGDQKRRWRLLYLIDEMPTLGRLPFFETMLAAARGYGIKLALIAQSLNQVEGIYGRNHSINDNASTQMTYYARSTNTAKHISDMLGQQTATETRMSTSRKPGGWFASSISESEHDYGKPLMAADEIMRLPYDIALLSIVGMHPYLGKKLMDFQDRRFMHCMRPAPDSVAAQQAELPPRPSHGWTTPPIEPAVDVLEALKKRFGIEDAETGGTPKSAKRDARPKPVVVPAYDALEDPGPCDDDSFLVDDDSDTFTDEEVVAS